ncbi:MAG: Na+/H+ antiporter [uncultured Rubrobacteraceae bacterium]|uniref:Na+/H+ antiporter n=1 Tax=uncultured Rubrobacteraceae bacterium TaxID=349277 RepID=A0A6J4THL3_9ACTN|nr:MAG: Na+/H+ antiporter [uncultured Rubrobacteraceae bacterium]
MAEIGVIFLLLAAVAALATVANRIGVPYPILLVVSGLALAFVPPDVLPRYELDPEIVFVLFLPPLLFASAFFTSWRDFRRNLRPISLLAVGLVLFTVVGVAAVAHYVAGMSWAAAFVLGAIVSPTDAIAATSIAQRLGVPRRIVTLLEGESLVNDATGIVAYRIAYRVAGLYAVFSIWGAGLQFVVGAVGGVAVGLAAGWVVVKSFALLDDTPVEIVVSLLAPFTAYLAAEELPHIVWHELLGFEAEPFFSGVLAAVAAGIYVGRFSPTIMSPTSRLEGGAVWNVVVFLLNGLAFILIGLQLPIILRGLGEYTNGQLLLYGVAVSLAVILVRVLWVFPATYLPRIASRAVRERDPAPPWRNVAVLSWAGMRGVISLAAALALPETTRFGDPFPFRDLILFLTFAVILATLVIQGLSLPFLIRALGLEDDGSVEREEVRARIESADAALARLEELTGEEWVREDTAERVRGMYGYRRSRFVARKMGEDEDGFEERSQAFQRLQRELLVAQRNALVRLRNEETISDEALHRIERDLDLEETRLDS